MKMKLLRIGAGISFALILALLFTEGCKKRSFEPLTKTEVPGRFSKEERSLISAFINSKEYSRITEQFLAAQYGELDWGRTFISYVDDDIRKPLLTFIYTKKGKVSAALEIVPIPESFSNVLPGNEHYLVAMIDYTAYDAVTNSGRILVNDLNYDGYMAVDALLSKGKMEQLRSFAMPEALRVKYAYLKKRNEMENRAFWQEGSIRNKVIPCDSNGNGNLGFGECFACFTTACNGAADCAFLCAAINLASVYGGIPIPGGCTLSIAAACVYLSIVY